MFSLDLFIIEMSFFVSMADGVLKISHSVSSNSKAKKDSLGLHDEQTPGIILNENKSSFGQSEIWKTKSKL